MFKSLVKAVLVVGGAVAGALALKNASKIKQKLIDMEEDDEVEFYEEIYNDCCKCEDLPTFNEVMNEEQKCCGKCQDCDCCNKGDE